MLKNRFMERVRPRSLACAILVAFLFSLAYTQAPLFTSNENQYFLHGLASAGYGALPEDWLANTKDPTPVFSVLVDLTWRVFHSEWIFYAYHAALLGLCLYALGAVVLDVYPSLRAGNNKLIWLVFIIVVFSSAGRFVLSRILGPSWVSVFEDGVAEQRVLDTIFQPSTFGVLLIVSIALFLRRNTYAAVLCAVLAATVHPTYLLGAAVLILGFLIVLAIETRQGPPMPSADFLRRVALPGGVALLAVLPILWYVFSLYLGSPPDIIEKSQDILVNYRLPHHALFRFWLNETVAVKIAWIIFALYLVRRSRVFPILLISSAVTLGLSLWQYFAPSDGLALIFPWRISAVLVPMATAMVFGRIASWIVERKGWERLQNNRWWISLAWGVIALVALGGGIRMIQEFREKAYAEQVPVEQFIAQQRKTGQVFLIPVRLDDFRLSAGAPAYVDLKAIPYRPGDVLEWYRRLEIAISVYSQPECGAVPSLHSEGITHIVLPAKENIEECPALEIVYQDDYYIVVEIRNTNSF